MSLVHPPEFGLREEGKQYQRRPGSYAVIVDDKGNVAVMSTIHHGLCLPGGGADPGEAPLETLRREVAEECGHEVTTAESLGFAIEYVFAVGEGYFAKECTFFKVELGPVIPCETEPDHMLIWVPMRDAIDKLSHKSQRWALSLI